MSCIESCVFFRQSPYGCKQCTRCGICLPLYCHSMLQEHSPDGAFEYYVLVWKLNASLQLWHIKKQQLILIIKLVTSVFWFPCFNRKINQRVLFVFSSGYCIAKFACSSLINRFIILNRSNLQLQIMSCIFTGYLEKIRRNDDVIVLIHIPESYDFSLASKSKWTEEIENIKSNFCQIFNTLFYNMALFFWWIRSKPLIYCDSREVLCSTSCINNVYVLLQGSSVT